MGGARGPHVPNIGGHIGDDVQGLRLSEEITVFHDVDRAVIVRKIGLAGYVGGDRVTQFRRCAGLAQFRSGSRGHLCGPGDLDHEAEQNYDEKNCQCKNKEFFAVHLTFTRYCVSGIRETLEYAGDNVPKP